MISDLLVKGYAHEAIETELIALDCSKVWHVPLNIVYNPSLMWDAKAELREVSLNSKLPAVIFKFRDLKVGFGADI